MRRRTTGGELNFAAAGRTSWGGVHPVAAPPANETLEALTFIKKPGGEQLWVAGVRLTGRAAGPLPTGSICAVERVEWSHQRRLSCLVFTTKSRAETKKRKKNSQCVVTDLFT